MAGLGVDAYRFSISWPRVQPDGAGAANAAGLDFYDRLVDALLEHGIAPFPTLFHWDLPQALEDKDGWLARDTAYRFADYAALVAARLADRVEHWITLNEPFVHMVYGYALRHARPRPRPGARQRSPSPTTSCSATDSRPPRCATTAPGRSSSRTTSARSGWPATATRTARRPTRTTPSTTASSPTRCCSAATPT